MSVLPTDLIQEVRDDANLQNAAFPTDDDLMRWVSKGEQRLYAHVNEHVRRVNVKEYEFKRDSTTREYSLPVDYDGYFLYLEYFGGSGVPDEVKHRRRRAFNFDTGSTPDFFTIYNNRILIDPMPDVSDSNTTMRLGYQRMPQRKHKGSVQAKGSVSITLDSQPATGKAISRDSAYVNEKLRIIDGTGAGQEAEIAAFDADTFKASLQTTFSTALSTDSVYTFPMEVSRADEEVIVAYARLKARDKDNMPSNVERQDMADMMTEVVGRYKSRGARRFDDAGDSFRDVR